MKAGKDYLADKPGITTLEQLAEVRKAIKETKRKFAIMYSERLEVRSAVYAGELIKQGAIGTRHPDREPRAASHERAEPARVVLRQGALRRHPHRHRLAPGRPVPLLHQQHEGASGRRADRQRRLSAVPEVRGLRRHDASPATAAPATCASTGSRRTACATWGDGRLFILGTEGYIELRKYVNVASEPEGRQPPVHRRQETGALHRLQARCRCRSARSSSRDIVKRTEVAQDQEQALLAAELVLQGAEERDAARDCLKSRGGPS